MCACVPHVCVCASGLLTARAQAIKLLKAEHALELQALESMNTENVEHAVLKTKQKALEEHGKQALTQ